MHFIYLEVSGHRALRPFAFAINLLLCLAGIRYQTFVSNAMALATSLYSADYGRCPPMARLQLWYNLSWIVVWCAVYCTSQKAVLSEIIHKSNAANDHHKQREKISQARVLLVRRG